jgi:hypothetical protein
MATQYFSALGGTLIPHPGDTEIQDEAAEPGSAKIVRTRSNSSEVRFPGAHFTGAESGNCTIWLRH